MMTPEDAFGLLEAIKYISGTSNKLEKWKEDPTINPTKAKRPPINFSKCGIPVGAELIYVDDPSVKVVVESDRKVTYNNEITSLSAVVGRLIGLCAVQGSSYFTYNGKLITKIAEETQWSGFH